MMKKHLVLLLLVFVFCDSGFAVPMEEPLAFTATIPVDYGVSVPDDVIMLDRFAVGVEMEHVVQTLVKEDTFYIGTINEAEPGSINFVLLYYGNLPDSYDISIAADPGMGWYMYRGDEIFTIPIGFDYYVPDNLDPSVVVGEKQETNITVHILPDGPKNGIPVLGFTLSWEGERNIVPGEYQADIDIRVDVL